MTQKPRKQDFRKSKSKNFPRGNMPPDPPEAWAFGGRLGNPSVFILDPIRPYRAYFQYRSIP